MSTPSLDELKRLINPSFRRPLLLHGTGGKESIRNRISQGRWKELLKEKLIRCDEALKEPIPQLPRSLYDDFFSTGRRDPFERLLGNRRSITEDLAQAYISTEKTEYLDRCRDYIWATMEEFTWIAPAHAIHPLHSGIVTQVDLYSSETALLMADLWDLFQQNLDSETLEWMRYEILRRVLIPLRDHFNEQWWARRYESNWTGVCCGNSACALVLTALDEPWGVELLHRLLRTLDKFISTADPDGAWVEGAGYWSYGFLSVIYLSDLLDKITEGRFDLLENPLIKSTATFPIWMYLPPRSQVNFGDTGDGPNVFPEALGRLLGRFRDPSIAWYMCRLEEEGLLGGGSLRDLLWTPSNELQALAPKETSKWYRRIGVIVTRASWTDFDAPILAVKAGHNDEPHNHLDIGHFIYHCYGNSFIRDLGAGVYDRDYFGEKRYENPFCGAEGHNLIFVDGKGQAPGREYGGRIVEYVRDPHYDVIQIDLTKAYPSHVLSEAFRTLIFLKYEGLVLIDKVICQKGAMVESRLHFNGKPNTTSSGIKILRGRGRISVSCDAPSVNIGIGIHKGLKLQTPKHVDAQYISLLAEASQGSATIETYIVPYQTDKELHARLKTLINHTSLMSRGRLLS